MKNFYGLILAALISLSISQAQDTWNTTLVGRFGSAYGTFRTITSNENYVYTLTGNFFTVLDATDLANLQELSVVEIPQPIEWANFKSDASGNFVYLADRGLGLLIMDVTDPYNPFLTGNFPVAPTHAATNVKVRGNYAYLTVSYEGLKIIDISQPDAPVLTGYLNVDFFFDQCYNIDISGSYAYIAAGNSGLRIIDINNPAAPFEAGHYEDPEHYVIRGVKAENQLCYLALNGEFQVVDVTVLYAPSVVGSCPLPGSSMAIELDSGYAYVLDYQEGLRIIDIGDPANPAEIGYVDSIGNRIDFSISGESAFITAENSPLQGIGISIPEQPVLQGSYGNYIRAAGIDLDWPIAYVADVMKDKLYMVDVTDPAFPVIAGQYLSNYQPRSVTVSGSIAYLVETANEDGGLRLIDVSDPSHPAYLSFYGGYGFTTCQHVSIQGDYAYLAVWSDGLFIVDVSEPLLPMTMGIFDGDGNMKNVAVRGDYAYLAEDITGLKIVNIADPTDPYTEGSFNTPGAAYAVALSGDYAFVADNVSGVRIIDITDPALPFEVSSIDTPGNARDVEVLENYLYVADSDAGVRIIDITDVSAPVEVGYYDSLGAISGISVHENLIYAANADAGLLIISNDLIQSSVEESNEVPDYYLTCVPNPFSDEATVSFYLEKPGEISLSLLNSMGLEILKISDEVLQAGRHEFSINTQDLVPGVYLCRLLVNNEQVTKKIVKV